MERSKLTAKCGTTVLEKSKETMLEFYKGNSKSVVTTYKSLNTIK